MGASVTKQAVAAALRKSAAAIVSGADKSSRLRWVKETLDAPVDLQDARQSMQSDVDRNGFEGLTADKMLVVQLLGLLGHPIDTSALDDAVAAMDATDVTAKLRLMLKRWELRGHLTTEIAKRVRSTTPATFAALKDLADSGFRNASGQRLVPTLPVSYPANRVGWTFED